MATQMLTANTYEVAGDGVEVRYATTAIDGRPQFHYRDDRRDLNFTGDEIETMPA